MDTFTKFIFIAFVIFYIISPIDAMPGPIDDLIVLLLAFASRKGES